ncbi:unnamed protein product [Parascedosporium putredinis]|uniref:Cutinase n=1 Tax=Parascedosporium putredinis TaxID=1442378 RepID=A0A9P1M7D4_9PEZI|nr:unnamed protein product [Parascedosporium putredinis]CAI7990264.1 unnamed protein product [Parascedosporium putredinis]
MRAFTAVAFLAALASAQQPVCAEGLQIFIARGTGEAPGPGVTGNLGQAVAGLIPGSRVQGVDYPASLDNPGYFDSVKNGTKTLRDNLVEYAAACPNGKVAVMGYSQGAQITANAICGTNIAWSPFPDSGENLAALGQDVTKNIVGVVLFGDPTNPPQASFRKGSAKGHGMFNRPDISACEALGDRIVSYCDEGDVFCDAGSPPVTLVHLVYVQVYGQEVVQYLVRQFQSANLPPRALPR